MMFKRIFLALMMLFLFISSGYCKDVNQPLKLTIEADKLVYSVGEEIDIEATVTNISEENLKIYGPDYWGVSEIIIIDADGDQLTPRGIKAERKYFEEFMIIPPGESRPHIFKNLRWFHRGGAWEFAGEAQLQAGNYDIAVTITNPPRRFSESKVLEKTWIGTMLSNTLSIEVIEK